MLKQLNIPDPELLSLATGGGSHAAAQRLQTGQLSRRILQILAILDSVPGTRPEVAYSLRTAYALLCDVQATAPETVRSVLTLPCAGFWADACLRGTTGAAGYRFLASLAALAAMRAGHEAEIDIPVIDGLICLPAAGTLPAQGNITDSATVVVCADGGYTVTSHPLADGDGTTAPGWHPASLLSAGQPGRYLDVWLADRGPFRGPPGITLAAPLTAQELAGWQQLLDRAWQIVTTRHPEQAQAMTLMLRTLTPMAARPAALADGQDSATAMSAPGAVLLTPPHDGEAMALALLHEFQHTKLVALEHMVVLHSGDQQPRYFAPWREDPRPLGALLHGAYAHLGVAAYWHGAVTSSDGAGYGDTAEEELAYWVWAVRAAIAQLAECSALTSTGQRFVAGMESTASRLAALPVSKAARLKAGRRVRRDEAAWQDRDRRQAPWDSVDCQTGLGRWP